MASPAPPPRETSAASTPKTTAMTFLLDRRRRLRKHSTDAEALLWHHVRGRRLDGFKLRRQHSVGPFILDFFCAEERLAIELDGGQHFEAQGEERDQQRTSFLEREGIRVLRFNNDQVLLELDAVLEVVARALRG
jgi:adenine-specific DNA-methyltransferase